MLVHAVIEMKGLSEHNIKFCGISLMGPCVAGHIAAGTQINKTTVC